VANVGVPVLAPISVNVTVGEGTAIGINQGAGSSHGNRDRLHIARRIIDSDGTKWCGGSDTASLTNLDWALCVVDDRWRRWWWWRRRRDRANNNLLGLLILDWAATIIHRNLRRDCRRRSHRSWRVNQSLE
jgi:hypothetical protein